MIRSRLNIRILNKQIPSQPPRGTLLPPPGLTPLLIPAVGSVGTQKRPACTVCGLIFTHTGSRARAAGHRGVCVCLWAAGRCRIDVDGQRDRAPGPARRPPFAHGGKRQSGAVPLMGRDRAAYFPVQQMPAAALAVRNSSKLLLALARKFFLCLSHKNSLLCTMSIFFFWATFPRPPAKYRHG